jgi:Rrf2 family protein
MMALAAGYGGPPQVASEIAERQKLPITYLEQILVALRRSGLVVATRGQHGGYSLARPPEQITLADVIEQTGGPVELVDCPAVSGCCWQPESCALMETWAEARRSVMGVLAKTTLADVVKRQGEIDQAVAVMYSI